MSVCAAQKVFLDESADRLRRELEGRKESFSLKLALLAE